WRAEPRRLERPRGQAESQSRRDERKRRLASRCLERWPMGSWGNGGADGDGRSAERRRGCRLVTGRVVVS
ncbi:hypothetical protein HAX54_042365, partial [Datura stramonium]|nr:hypothetical protein [Datura stramonium]